MIFELAGGRNSVLNNKDNRVSNPNPNPKPDSHDGTSKDNLYFDKQTPFCP